jgi:hypothetical protein
MKITIELSKKGLPCMWEQGGAYSNTGYSMLIGDAFGNSKKAIYVKRKGELSCGEHALIPLHKGDTIVTVSQWRHDFTINIYKVVNVDLEEKFANLELINNFSCGEWDKDLDHTYKKIVGVAKDKATSYHCRNAMYIKED